MCISNKLPSDGAIADLETHLKNHWARTWLLKHGHEGMRWVRCVEVPLVRWETTGGFKQGCIDLNAIPMSLAQESQDQLFSLIQVFSTKWVWIVIKKGWNKLTAFSKCSPCFKYKFCLELLSKLGILEKQVCHSNKELCHGQRTWWVGDSSYW